MNKRVVFSIIICLILSTQFAWGGFREELDKLNGLKEELRQERISRINYKVDSYNDLKSLETKMYSLEDELGDLTSKKVELEEQLNGLLSGEEKLENEYDGLKNQKDDIKDFLSDKREETESRIKNHFSYRKLDMLEQVGSVDSLPGLFNVLEQESVAGESIDIGSGKIDERDVEILTVGGIFVAYRSTDGVIGVLTKRVRKDKARYGWDTGIDASLSSRLEEAFRIVKNRENEIFYIPVDVTQGTKSKQIEAGGRGFIGWLKKGGPVMIPIVAVAIAIAIMVIERLVTFRREYTNADVLMERIMALWSKGHKDEAIRLCESVPGPVARMLRVGLEQHQRGRKIVEETLHEQHLEELPKLEKYLSAIAVLAGIAPLLGLLGTVSGMIGTFQVITYHGAGDPRLLAGGISEALITTQAGLIIAVPVLLLHNYLSTKADRIASDMEKNAVKLINSLPD